MELLATGPFQNRNGGTFVLSKPWNEFDTLLFEVGNRAPNASYSSIDMHHEFMVTQLIRVHDHTTNTNVEPEYAIDVFYPHTINDIYFRSDHRSIFIKTTHDACIFRVFGIKV